jgi:hypothetical protein
MEHRMVLSIAGPDGFGYEANPYPFEAIDLVPGPGVTVLLDRTDDSSAPINLGANTFNFYGVTYTGSSLFASSNGLLTGSAGNAAFFNTDLTSSPSQATIAALWDDWDTRRDAGDQVLAKIEPGRLIIEWSSVRHFASSQLAAVTFQAILELNTGSSPGDIIFNYVDLNSGDSHANGATATVGIKDSGTQGPNRLVVSSNALSPDVGEGQAILLSANSLIEDIVDVTPDPRNAPVPQIDIVFSTDIDPSTFTIADLELTRNAGGNLIDSSVMLSLVSGRRYRVSGLDALTSAEGEYIFRVDTSGINDAQGNPGRGSRFDAWVMDLTGPRVTDVIDVAPDPRSGAGKAVSGVDVVFNEPINLATFDFNNLTLTRDDGSNLIDASVTVSLVSGSTYRINNLAPLTGLGGNHVLTVDGSGVRDLAGNLGTASVAIDRWLANDPPVIGLGGTLAFPEDSRPLVLAGGGTIADVDTPAFRNGTLTVSIVQNARQRDRLGIFNRPNNIYRIGVNGSNVTHAGVFIGSFTGGDGMNPLVIALNSNATTAATQALLRNINFSSVGEYLRQETRRVQFVLSDGEGGTSRPALKNVLITPVNEAPRLTLGASSLGYTLNSAAVLLAPNATVTDVDSPLFTNGVLRVQITSGKDAKERLEIGGGFTLAGKQVRLGDVSIGFINDGGGTLGRGLVVRFYETATREIVEQLMRSISFRTVGSDSTASRQLTTLLRDNLGGESSAIINVNVTP